MTQGDTPGSISRPRGNTLILGSRPEPCIPSLRWDALVYVNGGVANAPSSAHGCRVTHVLSDYALGTESGAAATRAAIAGWRVDKLVLIRASPEQPGISVLNEIDYRYGRLVVLTRADRARITTAVLGHFWRLASVLRSGLHGRDFVPTLLGRGGSKPSSGVFALLYSLFHASRSEDFVLAGMGLSKGGHAYEPSKIYHADHAVADRTALSRIARHPLYQHCVLTSERALAEACGLRRTGAAIDEREHGRMDEIANEAD